MRYLVVLLCSLLGAPLLAQTKSTPNVAADKKAVENAVQTLFDSMRASDTTRARSVMAPNLRIIIIGQNPGGGIVTRETTGKQFLSMLASRPAQTLDERSWNGQVQVDGDLASYWCEYAFFNAGKFSHCGVDVFQLYRSPQGWKIVNLAYNMRRENCDLKAIPPK
ncbi:nuclear transport factor 2 family protein [Adhaeribacter radiodurans]|uniref:Nuclear transport factor 2 family protein n=1 Tax=Adhaeribacter radiodurans TaxID=2745197 RepID=A0A7L7LAW0_9BACT|nr:nuclear transport factor 2 family protein [Adhaeribacter radiodurans]QMU29960.1 nuclear transport factor 2 family protein [Adhaeribacter radiodurans]